MDDGMCIVLRCLHPWNGKPVHHHTISNINDFCAALLSALDFRDRYMAQAEETRLKELHAKQAARNIVGLDSKGKRKLLRRQRDQ